MSPLDYWHHQRVVRLAGSEEHLPFQGTQWIVGPVVAMPEPVWRSLGASVALLAGRDLLAGWAWEVPLAGTEMAELLDEALSRVETSERIVFAADLPPDALPDARGVREAATALLGLLRLGLERGQSLQTWVD